MDRKSSAIFFYPIFFYLHFYEPDFLLSEIFLTQNAMNINILVHTFLGKISLNGFFITIFFEPKIMRPKSFFGPYIILDSISFCLWLFFTQNFLNLCFVLNFLTYIFGPKISFESKFFDSNFVDPKFVWTTKFFTSNFLGYIISWTQNLFWTKSFLDQKIS